MSSPSSQNLRLCHLAKGTLQMRASADLETGRVSGVVSVSPDHHHSVPRTGTQQGQRAETCGQKQRVEWCALQVAEGPPGQGMRAAPEAGEGLGISSRLEPPEGTSPEFSPTRLILDFQPPELQGINVLFQATASW